MSETSAKSAQTWALALTAAASFMMALDAMVVTTALDTIRLDLGTSIETLEWTMNGYNLSFAVLLLTGAALGDRFGRKRIFSAGLMLFVIASCACALAPDAHWLIAARIVQGVGAALVMPVGMALLSVAFPPQERAKALGQFAGVTGLAIIAGPALGGIIAQGLSWHWIFWLNVPLGLILLPLIGRHITESRGAAVPLDMTGLLLMTGASFGLVWGLIRANDAGWSSIEVSGTLAAGAILALAFVMWERRAAHPMVPMRLFRAHAFSGGTTAAFLYSAAMYGILFFIAQFLAVAQGHGPMSAGMHLLPWTATLFFVAPIAGRLVNKVGERLLVVIGSTAQAIGLAWISLIVSPDTPYPALLAPLILAGIGVSTAMPSAQNAVIGAVAPQEIGTASGIFSTMRFLGGTFGVAIAVTAFAASGSMGSAQSFAHGFSAAIGASAVLSLLAAVAGFRIPGRRTQTTAIVPQRA